MSSIVLVSIAPPLLASYSDNLSHADCLSFKHPSAASVDILLSFDKMCSKALGECFISTYDNKYIVIWGLVHITSVSGDISKPGS